MEPKIVEIAQRIKALREILEISRDEMAQVTGISVLEYENLEEGKEDFSFTFLYKCANKFGVEITELLTGENPHLTSYTVVRNGKGLPIKRRVGFHYYHLAALIKDKIAEPFLVVAKYDQTAENSEIQLSAHEGQEMDYVLEGTLKVQYQNHIELLNAGDSIYYDSGKGHGMVAVGGKDCRFLAIVMKKSGEEE